MEKHRRKCTPSSTTTHASQRAVSMCTKFSSGSAFRPSVSQTLTPNHYQDWYLERPPVFSEREEKTGIRRTERGLVA